MTRRSALVPIVAGFSITLLILLAVIAASISHINNVGSQMTSIIIERSRMAELASRMQDLHRQRYQSLTLASHLEDPFARDEELLTFSRLAKDYIGLRDAFLAYRLDAAEQQLWEAIRNRLHAADGENARIVDLLQVGDLQSAQTEMATRLARLQQSMMADWEAMAKLQQQKNAAALAAAAQAEQRIRRLAILLGGAALLMGAVIAMLAIRASRRHEEDQQQANAHMQGILNAIPDAVLQGDATGHVRVMNQAAKRLLGLQRAELQQLRDVLHIVNRDTRQDLLPPLLQEIQHGRPTNLPQNACLISANGMEFDVAGRCVPLTDDAGQWTGTLLTLSDVTEARALQRRQAGSRDLEPVTGLPLQEVLVDNLERNLLSKRSVERELAYLHIELDGVDRVTREAGQTVAEQMLREVAQLMLSRIRDSDTLARIGPHAFGLLLPACPDEVSTRILQNLEASVGAMRFEWQGRTYPAQARIGIVHAPPFAGAYDQCQAQAAAAAQPAPA